MPLYVTSAWLRPWRYQGPGQPESYTDFVHTQDGLVYLPPRTLRSIRCRDKERQAAGSRLYAARSSRQRAATGGCTGQVGLVLAALLAERELPGVLVLSGAVDADQFWALIEDARSRADDPADSDAVAAHATGLLSALPPEQIIAADRVMYSLTIASRLMPLWAAAYVINGGCSDDGFDYFRGWLIMQGRQVLAEAMADPDSLAGLRPVQACASEQGCLECEDALYIASAAYEAATGEEIPDDAAAADYHEPDADPAWDFDFDDQAEMSRRLPRLTALCQPGS